MSAIKKKLASLEDTKALAESIAPALRVGDALCLSGDLGAGKTTFTQHLVRALGCDAEVTSPTFTMLQTYPVTLAGQKTELWHYDLYRVEDPKALTELGLEEAREKLLVIEWPERCRDLYLPSQLTLAFSFVDNGSRWVEGTMQGDLATRLSKAAA